VAGPLSGSGRMSAGTVPFVPSSQEADQSFFRGRNVNIVRTRFNKATALVVFAVLLLLAAAAGGHAWLSQSVTGEAARLVEVLDLRPRSVVAEIGAGSGDMTVAMAQEIGADARFYATELPSELRGLQRTVDRAGLPNVEVVEAGVRTSNLPAGCCDAVFMRRVYHHFTHPAEINASILAALRPGGLLAIVDFEPRRWGRPAGVPEDRDGHGIRPSLVVEELTGAGFAHVRTIDDWSGNLYLVLFRKPQVEPR
jgi:ubiquinone/menaquinone biosynthesis C-methylase UbiE